MSNDIDKPETRFIIRGNQAQQKCRALNTLRSHGANIQRARGFSFS